MPLCSLLHRRCFPIASRIQPLLRSFHNLNTSSTPEPNSSISASSQPENSQFSSSFNPNPSQFTPDFLSSSSVNFAPLSRSQGFLSAEEAAAERRRRKRRLRIEPPIQIGQRPPPPPRDPRQPDSTSALTGPRLNLHNRVQSLIRAFDLDAASKLARSAVHARIRPTVFTCNAIIAAMHRAKRYEESKALFSYFFEQNTIVPNVVSYNYLINSLCDEGNVDEALSVYRRIIAEAPFGPSHVTYRHLTKGMVDAKRIEEAVELLREMLNKGHGADSVVYNNLIKGYLDLANISRADEFFNELKERCLVYDGIVNATYMEFWFEQGKGKEAMESYKSLLDKKYRMVPATCNVLLSVLLKYGKKEQAWALFEHMLDDHTPPTFQAVNTETFNIMVNEWFKEGKVEKAVETFRMSGKKERSKPFAMEVATFNNMIARFCEIDQPNEAETYFNELCSKSLNPDVLSFRTLIDAFLKLEQVDDAVKYLTRMVDSGLRVVASYGVGVFEKLLARGKSEEVFKILSKMGEKDPKPDFPVYEVVVKGFCDSGELEKVEEILKQMMAYGVVVSSSLKEVVRNLFEQKERGKELEDILDERKWRNSQSYSQIGRRNESGNSPFSGQNGPPSNQRLPWISNPQSGGQNVTQFASANGQNSSGKNIGEIVKHIGIKNQNLNQTNFQGVKNGSQWPREENQSHFSGGSKSFENHRPPFDQQSSMFNNGGTPHQPSAFQSSWSYPGGKDADTRQGEGNPVNYNGAHHQLSNSQSSWNFQGQESQSSVRFPEPKPIGTLHQPSSQPSSWSFQEGKAPCQWPEKENSTSHYQTTKPMESQYVAPNQQSSWPNTGNWSGAEYSSRTYSNQFESHQPPPTHQNSWSFSGTRSTRSWPEEGTNLGLSKQQSSWSYGETNRPIESHRQQSSFGRDETELRNDQATWQSQANKNRNMPSDQMGGRWSPTASTSNQYPFPTNANNVAKSGRNMESRFKFDKESQNTSKAGDWFAEGVFKTLQGSGDS